MEILFGELKGKTLTKIDGVIGDNEMIFETSTGKVYKLYHEQDCCESVNINDIIGDLSDIIGSPILLAEEVSNDIDPEGYKPPYPNGYRDSFTWTFYKLATIKGYVTIRWYGESNGYYSERVNFARIQ